LRLTDIASGTVPGQTGPFEIVLGFLNLSLATNGGFQRGDVASVANVVEFDYFPAGYYDDPIFGHIALDPTVSPTLISSNHEFATSFTTPLELTVNDWFHITLTYTASDQTLATTLLRNGQPYGAVANTVVSSAFSDFRVDALSVTSYSGAGDSFDSVLAHGVVDNVSVTVPDGPKLTGGFADGLWQVEFASRTNWLYLLERSPDFTNWTGVSVEKPGTGDTLILAETNRPAANAVFYRTNARRP